MGQPEAHVQATIDARSSAVYEVLADYRTHHPRIMPPSMFSDLEVESGGVGDGTVFHITLHVPGKDKTLHMRVGEPDPGHVLTETDLDTGEVTVFEVTSANGGSKTTARMSSSWKPKRGVAGWFDRFMTPPMLRRAYRKQLSQLDRYMHSERAPT